MQLATRRVYAGGAVPLVVDTVRFPDGSTGELELIRHPGAAAVVPCLTDPQGSDPTILMIKQYRIHVESHGPACVNPAGSQLHGAPSAVEEPGDGDLESFGEEVRGVAARVGVDR